MKVTVSVVYTAIARIQVDVDELEPGLPSESDLVRLMKEKTPELLRADQQQLVSISSVLVGDDEILVDASFA